MDILKITFRNEVTRPIIFREQGNMDLFWEGSSLNIKILSVTLTLRSRRSGVMVLHKSFNQYLSSYQILTIWPVEANFMWNLRKIGEESLFGWSRSFVVLR